MRSKNALTYYLTGTMGQILFVCLLVYLLRQTSYPSVWGLILLFLGGISSSLWGYLTLRKYKNYSLKKILKDFFDINQSFSSYLLVLFFLFINFFYIFFNGRSSISLWYLPVLFIKFILLGGIEEIGWRYTFQPLLEERYHYIVSTLITFMMWGIWHYAYFYIENTPIIDIVPFYMGLLVNCFILSSIYKRTHSLWLCVMTHSLINVFSTTLVGGNQMIAYICKVIIILFSIYLGG